MTISLWFFDRLPKAHRDHLQSIYNTHMLNSSTADPFKLALFRLMGKLDPARRSIPLVTATAEDWLWFQLAMVCPDKYILFCENSLTAYLAYTG